LQYKGLMRMHSYECTCICICISVGQLHKAVMCEFEWSRWL
jgi:hypothetical protein